jgi:uncharacterized Zn-binding protein involved in type VI secretion
LDCHVISSDNTPGKFKICTKTTEFQKMGYKMKTNDNGFRTHKSNKSAVKTRNMNSNLYPPPPPPPPPAKSAPTRVANLFTNKQKWPVLAAFFIALSLGAVGFAYVGIIVGIIAGLFLLTRLSSYRFSFKPLSKLLMSLLPIIATILFFMIFLLPIADYMAMPSGHSPDSLVKYISIMVAVPSNFISGSPTDVFPGIPIIVLISAIMMVIGGLNLQKTKTFLIALTGLLLYTLSPTIASLTFGNFSLRFVVEFYAIGFYLAWIGIIIAIVAKILPRFLNKNNPIPPNPTTPSTGYYSLMPLMFLPMIVAQVLSLQPHALIAVTPVQLDSEFEAVHHTVAGFLAALFAALGAATAVNQEEEEMDTLTLELAYPAGRSPKVFTSGWLFGARAILNAGKPDEEDVSDKVKWSGSGSFNPSVGARSRPSFNTEGSNSITLTIDTPKQGAQKTWQVEAVSPAGFMGVGDKAQATADAHGCPGCPHPVVGPIISGSPTVLVNGRPAAREGDPGVHAACCGPNTFVIGKCRTTDVLIDGKPAAKINDPTTHCGGQGQIIGGG